MVTSLRDRILSWLRSPERDGVAGSRLSDEIFVFIRLLDRVNHLPEVIAHDKKALRSLSEALGGRDPDGKLPDELRPQIKGLLGRDDELDDRVLDGATVAEVLPLIRELSGRLGARGSELVVDPPAGGSGPRPNLRERA